jgi:hypothetical protein
MSHGVQSVRWSSDLVFLVPRTPALHLQADTTQIYFTGRKTDDMRAFIPNMSTQDHVSYSTTKILEATPFRHN